MGVASLDALITTSRTLHLHAATALSLCPDNSLSCSSSSVWRCAWKLTPASPGLLAFWFGQRGPWQETGGWEVAVEVWFPPQFFLSLHLSENIPSSENWSSKFSLGSGFSSLQAGWGLGVVKASLHRSISLIDCRIINSSHHDFFSDSLSRSFLYCWAYL